LLEERGDLGGQDEIILVETTDLMGVELHNNVTPTEPEIGVVAFLLGDFTNPIDETQRRGKILEAESSFQAGSFMGQTPPGCLLKEAIRILATQRRNATPAR
jgi:hypothetical protein